MYSGGPAIWTLLPPNSVGPLLAKKDPRVALLFGLHRSCPEVKFVQVGSNDADLGDPLAPFLHTGSWTGLMIEPVEYVFDRLVQKHGHNPRLKFENIAVAPTEGSQPFYWLDYSEDLPSWYDQLGSFSLETILKHERYIPDIRNRIRKDKVPTITFEKACDRNNINNVDLIHIDTEGYDFEIIRSIEIDKWIPKLVIYEHKHLTRKEKMSAKRILSAYQYNILEINGGDTLCVHENAKLTSRILSLAWEWVGQYAE